MILHFWHRCGKVWVQLLLSLFRMTSLDTNLVETFKRTVKFCSCLSVNISCHSASMISFVTGSKTIQICDIKWPGRLSATLSLHYMTVFQKQVILAESSKFMAQDKLFVPKFQTQRMVGVELFYTPWFGCQLCGWVPDIRDYFRPKSHVRNNVTKMSWVQPHPCKGCCSPHLPGLGTRILTTNRIMHFIHP